jgi:hypothetical protein
LDNNPKLLEFAELLGRVCVETIEAGEMTKDLSILISKDAPWLTTEDFLAALDRRLQAKMAYSPCAQLSYVRTADLKFSHSKMWHHQNVVNKTSWLR